MSYWGGKIIPDGKPAFFDLILRKGHSGMPENIDYLVSQTP